MPKVITIFDTYATLATAFESAGYEVQAAILSDDDEREFYREKFENRVFVFSENIKGMCTCGVRNRAPHGLVAKLPDTVYEQEGYPNSQKELIHQIMRFVNDAKPNFLLVETKRAFLDDQDKFKALTDEIGNAGYDCFVLLHDHKSYITAFSQEKNLVESFDFPEIKSEDKVTKEFLVALAQKIEEKLPKE